MLQTKIESVKVSRLVKAAWNYKKEEPAKQAKLVENIKRNGQVESILVREVDDGMLEVVNGNHRLSAFLECGISDVTVFNLGVIDLRAAQRIAIELNETRFSHDKGQLDIIVSDLIESFSKEDLASTIDLPDFAVRMPKMRDIDESFVSECPKCKHRWS